jgi:hypothetical protein
MPDKDPPDDRFDAGLERIESKPVADAADRQEEADVLRTEANTELVREAVKTNRSDRRIKANVAKYVIPITVIYTIVPVTMAVLQGFSIGGFHLPGNVLVAAFAPTGLVALIGILKTFKQ